MIKGWAGGSLGNRDLGLQNPQWTKKTESRQRAHSGLNKNQNLELVSELLLVVAKLLFAVCVRGILLDNFGESFISYSNKINGLIRMF